MLELAKQLHDECVGQIGIDEVQKKGAFPDDEELKCYVKCLMDEMAITDDDGVIDPKVAIDVLPDEMKDIAAPIMRNCGAKSILVSANPCDTVYQTHKCYYETDKENYFLI